MYGTPVIAADVGGIPELVSAGKTGELFQMANKDNLKNKIEQLWNDKRKMTQYAQNCKNISFDTIEKYSHKLLKIYKGEKFDDNIY